MLRDRRSLSIAILAIVALALAVSALLPGRGVLEVTVMDVGEGLCIVMRTPSGKTLVMDCGTSSWRDNQGVGESVVWPYLSKCGVRRVDVAILSHPHEDHMSGYARLLRKCPAKLVLDPGVSESSRAYRDFVNAAKRCRATCRTAQRGQVLDMGDGVIVQVLSPAASESALNANDRSVVVRVVYGNTAFVLTGDADAVTEADILRSKAPLRSQVLQVGHHGSATATSAQWLASVRPQVAVISCGRRNLYGHPARQTMDRLNSIGARVYHTDTDGAVTMSSDGSDIRVDSALRHQ